MVVRSLGGIACAGLAGARVLKWYHNPWNAGIICHGMPVSYPVEYRIFRLQTGILYCGSLVSYLVDEWYLIPWNIQLLLFSRRISS
jgi:hypothetical protein